MRLPSRGGEPPISRPLYELNELAPQVVGAGNVRFLIPFSNDESASQYVAGEARKESTAFRETTNRVALLVGEAALAAASPYIPEDTILLVDNSSAMCRYMYHYVQTFDSARDPEAWHTQMYDALRRSFPNSWLGAWFSSTMASGLELQSRQWLEIGKPHPLKDKAAYAQAREHISNKAIIPWRANLASVEAMKELGTAIRWLGGNATMLNFTNVFDIASGYTWLNSSLALSALPVTPEALVLATGHKAKTNRPNEGGSTGHYIMPAIGPFHGLEEFQNHSRGIGTRG